VIEPTTTAVRVRGLELSVLRWGPTTSDRPPVVILHGWLDQALAWSLVARELVDRGRQVIAWDHRGHGASDHGARSSGYHFPEYVADVDGVFTALDLDGAVLVGHSMGGTIASLFAGLRPQRIAGLVLVDGLGPPAAPDDAAVDQLVAFLDAQAAPPAARSLGQLDSAVARIQRVNPQLPPALAQALARRATRSDGHGGVRWSWDPRHRTRSATAYDEDRHKLVLARIQAPVRLVYGEQGWYPGIDGLKDREDAIPDVTGRHMLPCGHAVHLEQPERLAELIDRA
jgi:pimeloyl-ACP methyl ester carboxylesterase